MDGRIDGFVSAAGTGGTVSGVSAYLRSQHPQIQIALADIPGSALYRYFTEGQLRAEGSSVVENIGKEKLPLDSVRTWPVSPAFCFATTDAVRPVSEEISR